MEPLQLPGRCLLTWAGLSGLALMLCEETLLVLAASGAGPHSVYPLKRDWHPLWTTPPGSLGPWTLFQPSWGDATDLWDMKRMTKT